MQKFRTHGQLLLGEKKGTEKRDRGEENAVYSEHFVLPTTLKGSRQNHHKA